MSRPCEAKHRPGARRRRTEISDVPFKKGTSLIPRGGGAHPRGRRSARGGGGAAGGAVLRFGEGWSRGQLADRAGVRSTPPQRPSLRNIIYVIGPYELRIRFQKLRTCRRSKPRSRVPACGGFPARAPVAPYAGLRQRYQTRSGLRPARAGAERAHARDSPWSGLTPRTHPSSFIRDRTSTDGNRRDVLT